MISATFGEDRADRKRKALAASEAVSIDQRLVDLEQRNGSWHEGAGAERAARQELDEGAPKAGLDGTILDPLVAMPPPY